MYVCALLRHDEYERKFKQLSRTDYPDTDAFAPYEPSETAESGPDSIRDILQDAENEIAEGRRRLERLSARLNRTERDLEQARKDLDETKKTLERTRQNLAAKQHDIENLKEEVAEKNAEIADLKERLEARRLPWWRRIFRRG